MKYIKVTNILSRQYKNELPIQTKEMVNTVYKYIYIYGDVIP